MVDGEPYVEQLEADSRHDEEVHSGDHVAVIPQEGDPALLGARIGFGLRQVARDRGATYLNPELRQLGLDLPSAPTILGCHPDDQSPGLLRHGRSARSGPRDPAPVASESLAMPPDHGLRLDDDESASPLRPEMGEGDPEHSIQSREARPWMSVGVHRELLSERELDDRLLLPISEQGDDAVENRDRERCCGPHARRILLESKAQRKAESDPALRLPSVDEQRHTRKKPEQNHHRRIMRTHSGRKLLPHAEDGVALPLRLLYPRRGAAGDLRLRRSLLQPQPNALESRLPLTRGV